MLNCCWLLLLLSNHVFPIVNHQQPVTWQPSKDGERLIGRILLNKRMKDGTVPADTGALLGLKVAFFCFVLLPFPFPFSSAILLFSSFSSFDNTVWCCMFAGCRWKDDRVWSSLCFHH